jgi:predicted Zn-dependent protease
MSENKYQKAIDVLSKGLEYDSKSKTLHFKLGNAYVNRNQSEKGVSHLQKALDLGYSDPKIYRMLGYLYRDLNQNDKAVESFKKYLAQADEEVLSASAKKKLITQIKRLGGSL